MRQRVERVISLTFLFILALAFKPASGGDLEVPESVLNEGGDQRTCVGCRFTITNDALGDIAGGFMTASNGRFTIEPYSAGLKPIHPPPTPYGLHVSSATDKHVVTWNIDDPEKRAEWHNLYREQFWEPGQLPPPVFDGHTCRIPVPLDPHHPQIHDSQIPPPGQCFVYLPTAANVYYETPLSSRTKGTPCP